MIEYKKDKIPIIIDTDIGDDIDDAIALCTAMQSEEIELLCVTTVFKNTLCRAKIARHLLDLGGFSDVPVYAGASAPLSNYKVYGKDIDLKESPWTYNSDLDRTEIDNHRDAVSAIIEILETTPEPVTIVTMGALTNIADLVRRRPDLLDKIEFLAIMGGSYIKNMCEYNFTCDPEAAAAVFKSGIPIKAVGVDITFECKLSPDQITRLKNIKHPAIKMLMRMLESWGNDVYLHDPLALMMVFESELVTFKKAIYHVEHGSNHITRGMCIPLSDHNWQRDATESHLEVAVDVDSQHACEECVKRLERFDCAKQKTVLAAELL